MQTIPAEQLQAFLTEAKASGVYEMYYIELATGLRRGELLELKWSDIDWRKGIIKVKRQIARVDGKVVEAPLKTKNSWFYNKCWGQAMSPPPFNPSKSPCFLLAKKGSLTY